MSPCDVSTSGAIELLFYGELSPDEGAVVERHVAGCAECRRALEELAVIRAALAARPDIAAPRGGDWGAFMARLDRGIRREADAASSGGAETTGAAFVGSRWSAASYVALAAMIALVTVSVLLLNVAQRSRSGSAVVQRAAVPAEKAETAETTVRSADDPGLASLSEQHFERSKLVVLGLATKDPDDRAGSDWAYEQRLASALLSDTRLYRMAAEQRGMRSLAGVMRDLELLLLEASMSEQPDGEALGPLQQLIRRRDLLTKMEVVRTAGS